MSRRALTVVGAVLLLAALAGPGLLVIRAERGQAAFGAAERLGPNRLASAIVDVEVGSRTSPLVVSNMAPGDRVSGSLEIRNAGTVTLRYALILDVGEGPLSDWLTWEVWPASGCDRPPSDGIAVTAPSQRGTGARALLGDPLAGLDPGDRSLDPGGRDQLCLAATLDIEAPNAVQGTTSQHTLTVVAEHDVDAEQHES